MISSQNTDFLNQTFAEFLDSIGYVWFVDMTYLTLFPIIGMTGTIFNIINAWIYSNKEFDQPFFFYFRLLSVVQCVYTFLAIAYGISYSPRYFPFGADSYILILVQLIYIPIGKFKFLFYMPWEIYT